MFARTLTLSLLLAIALTGCGLKQLLPTGPVVDPETWLAAAPDSHWSYLEQQTTGPPLIPLQVFALRIEEEFLIEPADDPIWYMHEVNLVTLRNGISYWFTLDSMHDGTQFVGLSHPELMEFAKLMPVQTYLTDLDVDWDEGEDGERHYRAKYTLPTGQRMALTIDGDAPETPDADERNGNAMNHSERVALVLIDLEQMGFASGDAIVDGESRRAKGIVGPFGSRAFIISQTGAGITSGNMWQHPAENGLALMRNGVELHYTTQVAQDGPMLTAQTPTGSEIWRFNQRGEAVEVTIEQGERQTLHMRFAPPLPDLRRTLRSPARSRVTLDVNEQEGYMQGYVEAAPVADGIRMYVRPLEPFWAAERRVLIEHRRPGPGALDTISQIELMKDD